MHDHRSSFPGWMGRRPGHWPLACFYRVGFALLAILAAISIRAQTEHAHLLVSWNTAQINFRITDNAQVLFENSMRRSELLAVPLEAMTRPALEYTFAPEWRGVIGYAYFSTRPYGNFPADHMTNEHRIWQQLTYRKDNEPWRWSHRLRIEQRSLQRVVTSMEAIIGRDRVLEHRFRSHHMLEHRSGVESGIARHAVGVFGELLMQAGTHERIDALDQWRAGAQYAFRPRPYLELIGGYMFQYRVISWREQVELGHVLLLQATLDLDLRRGKP